MLDEIDASAATLEANLRRARASLRENGVVVLRQAYDWRQLRLLLDSVTWHADLIKWSEPGSVCAFPPIYRWVQPGLACDLNALDPNTRETGSANFNETTLRTAVMTDLVLAILHSEIDPDLGCVYVRARTVLARDTSNGALALHKERDLLAHPGLHVVWVPLTAPDVVTNIDAPGLQFRLHGEQHFPKLRLGDIIIFSGDVEHGSHIPQSATHWRVGVDIRVFRWTDEDLLTPNIKALGYKPQRLH